MIVDTSTVEGLKEQARASGIIRVEKPLEDPDLIDGGGYDVVPDERHREICLHCPEKECRYGTCYRIRGQKEAKRKEKKK